MKAFNGILGNEFMTDSHATSSEGEVFQPAIHDLDTLEQGNLHWAAEEAFDYFSISEEETTSSSAVESPSSSRRELTYLIDWAKHNIRGVFDVDASTVLVDLDLVGDVAQRSRSSVRSEDVNQDVIRMVLQRAGIPHMRIGHFEPQLLPSDDIEARGSKGIEWHKSNVPEIVEHSDSFLSIVEQARTEGFDQVADRLVELRLRPLEEGEVALHPEPARHFVEYCSVRRQDGRPLMTSTPQGDLDATWKGPEGQNQVVSGYRWIGWSACMQCLGKGRWKARRSGCKDLAPLDLRTPS